MVSADFAVPELPRVEQLEEATEDMRVRLATSLPRPGYWFLRWPQAGKPALRIGAVQGGYVLDVPETASYWISQDGAEVHCEVNRQTSMPELRRILVDQVVPRALAHRGRLVLHAAAIDLGRYAIGLMGPSGFGKSTLSSAFLAHGGSVLSDDAVSMRCNGADVSCVGAYPGLRLWPDSAAAGDMAGFRASPVSARTTKLRLLPSVEVAHIAVLPLRAIVLLDYPQQETPQDIASAPVELKEAVAYLMSQSFKLDTIEPTRVSSLLVEIVSLVKAVPLLRVSFPRRFDRLPMVIEHILKDVSASLVSP